MIQPVVKEFEFKYGRDKKEKSVLLSVPIPVSISIPELGSCLMSQNKIPFFVEDELHKSLETFIAKETSKYYDQIDLKAIKVIQDAESTEIDQLIEKWAKAFKE
ncbi:uncharacterized protein LOC118197928, partial [Stegodyphus dumicola]|uniref:uncharacterized protein LOC118197928 n=1 Tax=Stegodyphus dumicola TaxID=202533 RepID=UPI0015B0F1BE